MDEILDDEEEGLKSEFGGGNISEIKDGSNSTSMLNSGNSNASDVFSIGQLSRMTTIRRVFEEFNVDITT